MEKENIFVRFFNSTPMLLICSAIALIITLVYGILSRHIEEFRESIGSSLFERIVIIEIALVVVFMVLAFIAIMRGMRDHAKMMHENFELDRKFLKLKLKD